MEGAAVCGDRVQGASELTEVTMCGIVTDRRSQESQTQLTLGIRWQVWSLPEASHLLPNTNVYLVFL